MGTRPWEGLCPNAPLHAAGMRTEPPPSLAVTKGRTPPTRAAAAPPDDPPGVRSKFHGLRVMPCNRFLVMGMGPNSGAFVLAMGMAPAARRRLTWMSSCWATLSWYKREPKLVTRPATFSRSFTPSGTPSKGRASPRWMRVSASAAAANACSRSSSATTAFNVSRLASMRWWQVRISSMGDASRFRSAAARSMRERSSSSFMAGRFSFGCWGA